MTEARHSELFAALDAFRRSMGVIAGDLALTSARLGEPLAMETLKGWRLERSALAEYIGERARTLAAGIETLTRLADPANFEDTAVDGPVAAVACDPGPAERSGVGEIPEGV